MKQKPLIVEMDEAKQELVQCITDIMQKHGLNCYMIEPYVAELYSKVQMTAQKELAQAKAQMEAANAASNDTK